MEVHHHTGTAGKTLTPIYCSSTKKRYYNIITTIDNILVLSPGSQLLDV
jgi:hypothetical protein